MEKIVQRFLERQDLEKAEFAELVRCAADPESADALRARAMELRRRYYGDKVYTRGLIEFTNYCQNDCYYCGIRRGNRLAVRYRLTKEEILECCREGYALGFRTFVLQGGEDGYYTDGRMEDVIRSVKEAYPDCALTLSVGEKSYESYRRFRQAGADRYLLRHETADDAHYRRLHPASQSPERRRQCLWDLKELGYQVGAGFMVGSPGQTAECLAEDLLFLRRLAPQMVGIGPFLPHHDTIFARERAGSVELTLYLLSVIRILLPKALIPATTALGTADPEGRERGLLAGANVVMPNLSPVGKRKQYELYDNKICTGEEAAECLGCLARRVESVGFRLVSERGDAAM
ncbi:MAG: [FeFe] hydrogenase H-cluster radical SAM maturase HydE [Eubacteriales bacterium]|nr:[FeFe] hydrogenase H-cluster radical SAM maturase HydE [Eubacteriales bacterium]